MIKLTPELEQKIKESGVPITKITLSDLAKAKVHKGKNPMNHNIYNK